MVRFSVVIPARYGSSRLTGKPLQSLGGCPLIWRVYEQAANSGAERVIVATEDQRVVEAVEGYGGEALLTRPDCASGTDRIAEVVGRLGFSSEDLVVNLQGDEPFMPPELIGEVAAALVAEPPVEMATACHRLTSWTAALDPNRVKVVRNQAGEALYFSRAPIPWAREVLGAGWPTSEAVDWDNTAALGMLQHIGIYGYRVRFLNRFTEWAPTALERLETLEQLRPLEYSYRIRVIEAQVPPGCGIDTPEDLEYAQRLWQERRSGTSEG